jgi:hypothetical protein
MPAAKSPAMAEKGARLSGPGRAGRRLAWGRPDRFSRTGQITMTDLRSLARHVGGLFALAVFVLASSPTNRSTALAPVAKPAGKMVEVGKNVILEVAGKDRRVIVKSIVVLREGQLEGLLTRTMAKEHEYILASDCDARHIHAALKLAGGKEGSPVIFVPKYKPAHGSTIKVSLRYKKDGKVVTVPAQHWVREHKGKKRLDLDWVFAGSRFVPHPEPGKAKIYTANGGDLICLCNIDTAMLDLPVKSPKRFDSRVYEAHTDRIPAKDTPVEVILEVVPEKKGKK